MHLKGSARVFFAGFRGCSRCLAGGLRVPFKGTYKGTYKGCRGLGV